MKLEIKDSAIAEIRSLYIAKSNDIRSKISELEQQDKEVQDLLEQLKGIRAKAKVKKENAEKEEKGESIYHSELTWKDKVAHILDLNGTKNAKQIIDILFEYEPNLKNEGQKVQRSVSAVLSTHSKGKSSKFVKSANNGNDYEYSLNPRYKGK